MGPMAWLPTATNQHRKEKINNREAPKTTRTETRNTDHVSTLGPLRQINRQTSKQHEHGTKKTQATLEPLKPLKTKKDNKQNTNTPNIIEKYTYTYLFSKSSILTLDYFSKRWIS